MTLAETLQATGSHSNLLLITYMWIHYKQYKCSVYKTKRKVFLHHQFNSSVSVNADSTPLPMLPWYSALWILCLPSYCPILTNITCIIFNNILTSLLTSNWETVQLESSFWSMALIMFHIFFKKALFASDYFQKDVQIPQSAIPEFNDVSYFSRFISHHPITFSLYTKVEFYYFVFPQYNIQYLAPLPLLILCLLSLGWSTEQPLNPSSN